MRTLKKTLALVLVFCMVMSLCVTANAAWYYDDNDDVTYTEAVEILTAIGVIEGMGDGNLAPTESLTRAQAAKIVVYLLGAEDYAIGKATFDDVPSNHWASRYINYCAVQGIVDGYGNGKFGPEDTLTGYQWAKMLLAALGADTTDMVGSAWEIAVAKAASAYGIFEGNIDGNKTIATTREEACLYALNTLNYTSTPDSYLVVDGKGTADTSDDVIVSDEFDSLLEAELYVLILGSNYYTISTPANDTLLAKVHKVSRTSYDVDSFMNPGTSYVRTRANGGFIYKFYGYDAVASYTEGFDALELRTMTVAGYDFTGASVYVNGVITTLDASDIASRDYVGTTVALYDIDDDANTIDRIVVTQGYLTEVTKVVSTYKDASKNYIALNVYNPWAPGNVVSIRLYDYATTLYTSDYDYLTAEYEKDDMFITYWADADVADDSTLMYWEDIYTINATIYSTKYESVAYSGSFVASGAPYVMASGYAEAAGVGGALALGKEYTLCLDANGYVMGAIPADEFVAAVHYGIVLDYAWAHGTPVSNVTNADAKAAYENVKLFTEEGKVAVYGTAFKVAADGDTITNWVAKSIMDAGDDGIIDDGVNGTLVAYTLDASGKINNIEAAIATAGLNGTHTKGTPFYVTGTEYATDATVIFVLAGSAPYTGIDDIVAYTGYASVPTVLESNAYVAGYAFGSNYLLGASGAMSVVTPALPENTTLAQFAVITDATPNVVASDTLGYSLYTYEAIVNGVETEITFKAAAAPEVAANTLCTITYNALTGYVANLTPVEGTTKSSVASVASGYYALANGTAVLVDSKTVYYEVTAEVDEAGYVTSIISYEAVVAGTMTASNENATTRQLYVVAGSDNVADIVFFYVVE